MNDGSVTLKRKQKRQPLELHHATSSRGYPFSKESPWPLVFFGGGGGRGFSVVKPSTEICTSILVELAEVIQER
jgi:hypothetical protein